jgi:arsenite methyltransferase
MVISDLVTDKQIAEDISSIDPYKWCIDGALTKENYITGNIGIMKGRFDSAEVLDERIYTDGDHVDNRKITRLVIKAVKHYHR